MTYRLSIGKAALFVTVLGGGLAGWLGHEHLWRTVALCVLVSGAWFGVACSLRTESEEALIQWIHRQLGYQILVYILGFLLPCAGGAVVGAVLYRNADNQ